MSQTKFECYSIQDLDIHEKFENKTSCRQKQYFQRQSLTKSWKQTLVFMHNSTPWEKFNIWFLVIIDKYRQNFYFLDEAWALPIIHAVLRIS